MADQKCNPLDAIIIIGEGIDELQQRYLKLKVLNSDRDLLPYSMTDLLEPKRLYRDLGNAGCKLLSTKVQRQLLEMLQHYQQPDGPPNFLVVTRLGAFPKFYVRPDKIIGRPDVKVELASTTLDLATLDKYRYRGTINDWNREIGALCIGNSRLMFAASLACTGPILSLVDGPRTGGFQISGRAESGKTAAAMVAGSIWGCHRDSARKDKGFAESWNTTINQLEETARAHSDTLLVLDETNLAGSNDGQRAEAVLNGAFRLSEGSKKNRYNETEIAAWRLYFLSTSNLTLDELAEQGNAPIDDQHRGRLVDIGLPTGAGTFGIHEDRHGFCDGAALTDALKARCRSTFGTPGLRLVEKLYRDERSRSAAKRFVGARRQYYINRIRQEAEVKGLKPLERATSRFATVYAAGCLAIQYKIFRWSRKDLLGAILSCQIEGLAAAGKNPDQISRLRQRLVKYFVDNRNDFLNLSDDKPSQTVHALGSVPGYLHEHNGKNWIYVTSNQLKAIIGADKAAGQLKRQLVEEGLMSCTGSRAVVQRPIFNANGNKGYRWVHAFRASLFDSSIEAPSRRALNRKR